MMRAHLVEKYNLDPGFKFCTFNLSTWADMETDEHTDMYNYMKL